MEPSKPTPDRPWLQPVLFLVGLAIVTITALILLDFALSYGLKPDPATLPTPPAKTSDGVK